MRLVRGITVGVVAVAALVVGPAAQGSPAIGSDPNADASFISKLETSKKGRQAVLVADYTCAAGDALWVSAKQTKTGERSKKLKKEGSSEVAAAWLQSHRNEFVCDGTAHQGEFVIDKVEDGSKGKLVKGEAWVQFCVTQGGEDLVLSKSGWVGVS